MRMRGLREVGERVVGGRRDLEKEKNGGEGGERYKSGRGGEWEREMEMGTYWGGLLKSRLLLRLRTRLENREIVRRWKK